MTTTTSQLLPRPSRRRETSWKRRLIHLLDNRIGRSSLAFLATVKARQLTHADVAIGFDGGWYHRIGRYRVPDGPRFEYFEPTVLAWKDEIDTYFRDAADFWFHAYSPNPGDVIVDVGAGRGEDVLPFTQAVGPRGRVIAIEAHPRTYSQLERLCRLNRLTNVVPIQAAVLHEAGTVRIEDGEQWESNTVRQDGPRTSVRATTVDDISRNYGLDRIDFLKINIEGAETRALAGMRDCLARVRTICVCCHDFRANRGHGEDYRTRDAVVAFLKQNGFVISHRDGDPRDYVRDHVFGHARASAKPSSVASA